MRKNETLRKENAKNTLEIYAENQVVILPGRYMAHYLL